MTAKILTQGQRYFVIHAIRTALHHCEDSIFSIPDGDHIQMGDIRDIIAGVIDAFAAQEELNRFLDTMEANNDAARR